MCGAMNPVGNVYCDKCRARLMPMVSDPETPEETQPPEVSSIKGLSLPTIPLDERAQTEASPEAGEFADDDDWLSQFRDGDVDMDEGPLVEEDDEAEEVDDWLSQLRDTAPDDSAMGEAEHPVQESEDDWLSQLRAPEPPEAIERPDTFDTDDDWLSQLRDTAPDDSVIGEPEHIVEESEDDWLSQLRAPGPPEAIEISDISDADDTDDDWLSQLRGETLEETISPAVPTSETAPDEFELEEDAIPDWLQELTPEPGVPGVEAPEAAAPWEEAALDEAAWEPEAEPGAVPDWLQELAPETGVPEPAAPWEEAALDEAAWEPEAEPGGVPDWLQELAPETGVPEPGVPEAPHPPFAEKIETDLFDETPDWLQELALEEEEPPILPSEVAAPVETEPEIEAGALPDWLTGLKAEVAPDEVLAAEPSAIETLVHGEIPAWVKDMQPRREEAPEEVLETEGLLQGLRGVIAPSEVIEQLQPSKRPLHIKADEATLSRAQLLQDLVMSAIEPPKPQPYKAQLQDVSVGERSLRWLIALALIVVTLGTLMFPALLPAIPSPTLSPSAPYDTIQNLNAGETVLLVFEYGPAESDEMDAIAQALVRHLLDRAVDLSIATTRPEGVAVAARLMKDMTADYTLIGYRPGGVTGIAQILREAQPTPQLLVILTARPGVLRWWVEQTYLEGAGHPPPIVAGLSAALEPFAGPYLAASPAQLAGSLIGLSQAAAYERHQGIEGDATRRLNALAVGHVMIVVLILGGAIPYAIVGRRRRKEQ